MIFDSTEGKAAFLEYFSRVFAMGRMQNGAGHFVMPTGVFFARW